LNEDERKALYVCINEKIPRALLRTIWDTSDLDGAGLLHALLQHAINPCDMLCCREAYGIAASRRCLDASRHKVRHAALLRPPIRVPRGTLPNLCPIAARHPHLILTGIRTRSVCLQGHVLTARLQWQSLSKMKVWVF